MAIDKDKITFVDFVDRKGNVHSGQHSTGLKGLPGQSSKASSNFHRQLSQTLSGANSKREARIIIAEHHRKHMKVSCK